MKESREQGGPRPQVRSPGVLNLSLLVVLVRGQSRRALALVTKLLGKHLIGEGAHRDLLQLELRD